MLWIDREHHHFHIRAFLSFMTGITDIHLSVKDGGFAIIFPEQRKPSDEEMIWIDEIRKYISEHPKKKLIRTSKGIWRVSLMREGHYALRAKRPECPKLEESKIDQWIQALLLESKYRKEGGLILITGLTGAGKTTTFSAVIRERLLQWGGYALTLEDPPEDMLEGWHGAGYCEQLDIEDHGDSYAKATHIALRCFPAKDSSILGFGEVRDGEAAASLLRVALDGHLVFATMHAASIDAALQRLTSLARSGGEDDANLMLSTCLQVVVHQKFLLDKDKEALKVCALPFSVVALKQLVRNGKFEGFDKAAEDFAFKQSTSGLG